jgi:hypothetical protein
MELGNYPPEVTLHALGQAIPSPPPVATMPTAMLPVPGFPDHDVPTQLPTHDILVPTSASAAVDAASFSTTATAATTEEQKTADDDNSQISDAN